MSLFMKQAVFLVLLSSCVEQTLQQTSQGSQTLDLICQLVPSSQSSSVGCADGQGLFPSSQPCAIQQPYSMMPQPSPFGCGQMAQQSAMMQDPIMDQIVCTPQASMACLGDSMLEPQQQMYESPLQIPMTLMPQSDTNDMEFIATIQNIEAASDNLDKMEQSQQYVMDQPQQFAPTTGSELSANQGNTQCINLKIMGIEENVKPQIQPSAFNAGNSQNCIQNSIPLNYDQAVNQQFSGNQFTQVQNPTTPWSYGQQSMPTGVSSQPQYIGVPSQSQFAPIPVQPQPSPNLNTMPNLDYIKSCIQAVEKTLENLSEIKKYNTNQPQMIKPTQMVNTYCQPQSAFPNTVLPQRTTGNWQPSYQQQVAGKRPGFQQTTSSGLPLACPIPLQPDAFEPELKVEQKKYFIENNIPLEWLKYDRTKTACMNQGGRQQGNNVGFNGRRTSGFKSKMCN